MQENEKQDGRHVGEGIPLLARLRQFSEMPEKRDPEPFTPSV
jgi:hypothetical protein